ncbi:GntR family transcriptional regulator [Treponema sp.]|uniref:GntR family transcriptional regulator n=1 Tax=Treponema sp. TaxID=166 RepID=UPI00298ECA92|nr:GntR family transcriptional regulator [Treponema sp.]MCQ2241734.1 GntR family transcriptional regulator [Treponema sp.]
MKDITIELDKTSKVKLYHQLYQVFVEMIDKGDLPVGTKLPSIRNLSEDYNISRNTVTKAYSELEKDGYIYSLVKSGFFVKNPADTGPVESVPIKTKTTEKEEDSEIPTVDFLLRNSTAEPLSEDSENSELILTNMDAVSVNHAKNETMILKDSLFADEISEPSITSKASENYSKKEVSLLLNSGDMVKSVVSNEKILSPIAAFIDSCITALAEHHNRLEGDNKIDIQGEAPLRIALAAFIYKYHRIDINPAQIALGSNLSYSIFHLLQLDEFKNPSKSIHGLLQMAENSISPATIEPVAAITEDIDQSIISAFNAAGIKTEIVDMNTMEEQIEMLDRIKATIFISSTRTIKMKNISPKDRQIMFNWLKAKEYRYFIEYDNMPESHNYETTENYSVKDKVVYINSFANLISKSINTSFMFLPKKIVESYREKYRDFGSPLSMIDQCGLIDFLIKGKLYNYLTNLEML